MILEGVPHPRLPSVLYAQGIVHEILDIIEA
jgi:hypothetical protein